jgi:hypothetical protein
MLRHSARQDVRSRPEDRRHRRITTNVSPKLLVFSGIVMFGVYIGMDIVASRAYDGYSYRDQTISELSAIGAPTRNFWMAMSPLHQILAFAFAFGVVQLAGNRRRLRLVGWLLLGFAVTNVLWWFAPMHQREVLAAGGGTWQDTMHLVLGGISSVLFFATIGVGAFAFGRGFRLYSFVTVAALLVFGTLMSMQTGGVSENESTAWLGIWERIAVEGSLLWQAVFAAVLLWDARESQTPGRSPLRRIQAA